MTSIMSKPRTSKRAACVFTINYSGSATALKGCINDGNQTKDHLRGYEHVETLSDETALKPTRDNILASLRRMARMSNDEGYTKFVIHYSGHGVTVADASNDEDDRHDEAWYTIDKKTILDDEIREIINDFTPWSTVLIIMDACHSGTGCDLPLKYLYSDSLIERESRTAPVCNVLMISGCRDTQTSADMTVTRNSVRTSSGAMTSSLYSVLDDPANKDITIFDLRDKMHDYMRARRLDQRPQISSSRPLHRTTKVSEFFDFTA